MATGPIFQQTRPFGDDIVFRSSTTGEHVLDAYLEDAERGGKTLGDLLDVAFHANGDPKFTIGVFNAEEANAIFAATQDAADAAASSAAAASAAAGAATGVLSSKLDKAGGTMTGQIIHPFADKQTQTITTSGTVNAVSGTRYIIAASNVTLVAPAAPAVNSYHGVVVCPGVVGFVWDFGSTKLRGSSAGTVEWNSGPMSADLHYLDATRGYV